VQRLVRGERAIFGVVVDRVDEVDAEGAAPQLDAVFPAFYLSLLAEEARGRRAAVAAATGAAITVALMPVAPAGLPVIAASLAALIGLRRT
jgi:predicted branched-subunit amino acid permease